MAVVGKHLLSRLRFLAKLIIKKVKRPPLEARGNQDGVFDKNCDQVHKYECPYGSCRQTPVIPSTFLMSSR